MKSLLAIILATILLGISVTKAQDCSIVDGGIICTNPPPIIWEDTYLPIIINTGD
ncbi:hypothetical protein Rctr71_031 [Virus Rctr71]|nr:hypothetical protein Rctr71_031 [Virus Rctr71]